MRHAQRRQLSPEKRKVGLLNESASHGLIRDELAELELI